MRGGVFALATRATSSLAAKAPSKRKPATPVTAAKPPLPAAATQKHIKEGKQKQKEKRGAMCKLSPALSDVLKVSEATRNDALKKVWDYIKAHKLQSADKKTEIICDEKLKIVFARDKLTLTEVMKYLSPHISKKA